MTNEVYQLVQTEEASTDFRLRDQLTGAAVSTMSNISEGFARYHKKDFIRFLDYAQSSAAEVKSLLYVALDQDYGSSEQVKRIQEQSETSQRMILSLLKHVRSTLPGSTDEAKEPTVSYDGRGDPTGDWIFPPQFIETRSSDDEA